MPKGGPIRSNQTVRIFDALSGREYPVNVKRALHLIKSYGDRFQINPEDTYILTGSEKPEQQENPDMPKMPSRITRLDDGTYLFKAREVKTTQGQYGPQEEISLEILDEGGDPTGEETRCWIGHNSYKTIKGALSIGLCRGTWGEGQDPDEDDPLEWSVVTPMIFKGIVIDGKIKKFKRA